MKNLYKSDWTPSDRLNYLETIWRRTGTNLQRILEAKSIIGASAIENQVARIPNPFVSDSIICFELFLFHTYTRSSNDSCSKIAFGKFCVSILTPFGYDFGRFSIPNWSRYWRLTASHNAAEFNLRSNGSLGSDWFSRRHSGIHPKPFTVRTFKIELTFRMDIVQTPTISFFLLPLASDNRRNDASLFDPPAR